MALKAGYKGIKNNLLLKLRALPYFNKIGTGLEVDENGLLNVTGIDVSVVANPDDAATDDLNKLQVGDTVYAVNDNTKCYQVTDATESAIVDADYIPFLDSSAASGTGAPKKSTWSNFISKIKAKITEYVTWAANGMLGAKNLWKTTLASTTSDTITWLQNDDGTVTANTSKPTTGRAFVNVGSIKLPVGRYKLSGCPNGGNLTDGYYLRLQINTPTLVILANDVGNGAEFDVSDSDATMVMYIAFEKAGLTADNLVFKPMITLAADTESDYAHYVPYAMTNRELTNNLLPVKKTLTGIMEDVTFSRDQVYVQNNILYMNVVFSRTSAIPAYTNIFSIPLTSDEAKLITNAGVDFNIGVSVGGQLKSIRYVLNANNITIQATSEIASAINVALSLSFVISS